MERYFFLILFATLPLQAYAEEHDPIKEVLDPVPPVREALDPRPEDNKNALSFPCNPASLKNADGKLPSLELFGYGGSPGEEEQLKTLIRRAAKGEVVLIREGIAFGEKKDRVLGIDSLELQALEQGMWAYLDMADLFAELALIGEERKKPPTPEEAADLDQWEAQVKELLEGYGARVVSLLERSPTLAQKPWREKLTALAEAEDPAKAHADLKEILTHLSEQQKAELGETEPAYTRLLGEPAHEPSRQQLNTLLEIRKRRTGERLLNLYCEAAAQGKPLVAVVSPELFTPPGDIGSELEPLMKANGVAFTWDSLLLTPFPEPEVVDPSLTPEEEKALQKKWEKEKKEIFDVPFPALPVPAPALP